MKRLQSLLMIALLPMAGGQPAGAKAGAPAQAAAASPDENDRMALELLNSQWLNAYKSRDGTTLNHILADDFIAVYPDDRVLRKADLIAAATGTTRTVETVSWDRLRIMVFGDVAVVTARSTLTGTAAGKPFAASNDYADVYAKRGGRWLAVSAHVVRATPTP